MSEENVIRTDATEEYVTVMIGQQLFGLPIGRVQDVFMPDAITKVPLASPEIAVVLNLRGRIVTAINMRRRLGLPVNEDNSNLHAVGVEQGGEAYGLVIDSVGEVLNLPVDRLDSNPVNLDRRWAGVSAGVFRLDGQLLVILDIDRVLAFGDDAVAA